jgi:hypothetical protein
LGYWKMHYRIEKRFKKYIQHALISWLQLNVPNLEALDLRNCIPQV